MGNDCEQSITIKMIIIIIIVIISEREMVFKGLLWPHLRSRKCILKKVGWRAYFKEVFGLIRFDE